MTRRLITIKWALYSLWTLLFLLVQQLVLPYIRIWGVHPFVLPALAAIAASFEGKREGPVFALVLGLICDQLFSGAFPCFYAVTLLLAALVLPRSWFWVAWFWQMNNISLMGMTLYMHRRLRRLPEDIWIQDGGTVITVYAPRDTGEMNRE